MAKPAKKPPGHASAAALAERSARAGDARKPPKPPKSPKKKPARVGKGPPVGFFAAARAWVTSFLLWTTAGLVLGGAGAGAVAFRGALERVDNRLSGQVWSVPGRVYSAPVEVWPGLRLDADQLAAHLVAAGYARVPEAEKPGDFSITADAVHVMVPAYAGPGYDVPATRTLVTFRDGRVATTSPKSTARFGPAVLATVRGADNENRSPVPLAEIPKHVRDAVLAMEDARFYEHDGIDPLGIARALWVNLRAQAWEQGGSTLTQQLVKNVFLTADRTAARKAQEALLSVALEHRLAKDEILELYLNEIYLGQAGSSAVCGVDAAARAWFGKPVQRLAVAEAATIAGVIASPNAWSPLRHPVESTERRNVVLDRMVATGALAADAAKAAQASPLELHPAVTARQAPWAGDAAVEQVEAALGAGAVAARGVEVHTTVSPALQALAERAVAEGMAEVIAANPKLADVQAALVVLDARTGGIVAMVGGRDYATSSYNRAMLATRQLGSTVKALTLLAAFETDPALSPATRYVDEPISRTHDGKTWTPANYDRTFLGPVSLRHAIATSRNIPAVLLAEHVGRTNLKRRLQELGLANATDYPSAALGGFGATPLELATAYAVFTSGGKVREPRLVTGQRVEEALAAAADPTVRTSYSRASQWLARDVLRTVMDKGTGKKAAGYGVGKGAAGKSGTTDGYVDAWFAGVTGPYAVVAWVGDDKNRPIGLTGSAAALPMWARFVAWSGTSDDTPSMPDGLVRAEVCEDTDLPPCPACTATRSEVFRAGHVPAAQCGPAPVVGKAWSFLKGLFGDPEAPTEEGEPVRIKPRP